MMRFGKDENTRVDNVRLEEKLKLKGENIFTSGK